MNAMTSLQALCEHVTIETANVKVFTLRAVGAPAEFLDSLEAGKHVALYAADMAGTHHQRLYSITRKRGADRFDIAVKREGHGGVSDQLHATLQAGSTISVQFVAGDISLAHATPKRVRRRSHSAVQFASRASRQVTRLKALKSSGVSLRMS